MAYHWNDGWYFERLDNGNVRIFHIEPGDALGIADADIEIDPESWNSIVAEMAKV